MRTIEDYRKIIEDGLTHLSLPDSPESLYEPVKHMMGLGGKRIRPVLLLLCNEIFGGAVEQAYPAALAIEVFHNFTLVHDDLMDAAELRRGKETVHKKWNASTAVLSGDVMMVLAYELLAQTDNNKLPRTIRMFGEAAKRVCEGQQLDMIYEDRIDLSVEEYLHMTSLKTAALLAGSMCMGAHLADASEDDINQLGEFGYAIGTAFQVQDDLLDAYGQSATFGKKIGGDIIANKKTCLTLRAFELAGPAMKKELSYLFSRNAEVSAEQKLDRVMEIYDSLEIKHYAQDLRDRYYSEAIEHLDNLSKDKIHKSALYKFAEQMIIRER